MAAGSTHLEPTLFEVTLGQFGHRNKNQHRSVGFGVVYTAPDPPLVTSAKNQLKTTPIPFVLDGSPHGDPRILHVPSSALPNLSLPLFHGSNPKLWVKHCETYFDVYAVDPYLWVKVASMNLVGSTAL